jgi:energy-converting hydrogenase Eha subunit C
MVWTALGHLGASKFAAPTDAAIVGIDRDLAAALACFAGAIGLLLRASRVPVAILLLLAISYMLSSASLDDALGVADLGRLMMALGALYLCWPQLIPVKPAPEKAPNDQ